MNVLRELTKLANLGLFIQDVAEKVERKKRIGGEFSDIEKMESQFINSLLQLLKAYELEALGKIKKLLLREKAKLWFEGGVGQ